MPPLLPRFRPQLRTEDMAKLDRVVEDSEQAAAVRGSAGGDAIRLRGVPVVARGVRGAILGSVPGGQRLK